jgi:hypothetical protein
LKVLLAGFVAAVALAALAAWLVFIGLPLDPRTPALLEGASAEGSRSSGFCPQRAKQEQGVSRESHAPLVETRLAQEFPPGTSGVRLQEALVEMGFVPTDRCAEDSTIHRAIFRQSGGGLARPTIFALVAWKSDPEGRIVWTKANVAYYGL